ncbi:MAG: hypothetical protein ACR2LR_13035 [Hassallia sp.]
MADNPLGRSFFPIGRKTSGDARRSLKDPFGYFSCTGNAVRFLELEEKAKAVLYSTSKERKAYTRGLVLADGTKLTPSVAGETISVVASQVTLPVGSRGSRTVIIKTGKKIPDRTVDSKTIKGGYHTISFRFPAWATVWCISDALGELIPAAKLDVSPSATKAFPYFTVKGGRKYLIMSETAAEENTDANVPETAGEMEALATQQNLKAKKAAGGDA